MTTKKMIEVMQAFIAGKQVQFRPKNSDKDWEPLNPRFAPLWNWENEEYRVKPEREYRPFTYEEATAKLLFDVWTKKGDGQGLITFVGKTFCAVGAERYTYKELLDKFTFEDGAPCGVLELEDGQL